MDIFFVWKSIKNCRCSKSRFFKNILWYARKLKTSRNHGKSDFLVKLVWFFAHKVNISLKKRSFRAPAVFDALSNKKNIGLSAVLWSSNRGNTARYAVKSTFWEKWKEIFRFFKKQRIFRQGSSKTIKILAENWLWKRKKIVFFVEQNTGYLPINLSQFHNFWWKLTVWRGGGA